MKLDATIEILERAKGKIEDLKDSLQEVFDNRSDKWQESDKGSEAQDFIDFLDDQYNDIDSIICNLEDNNK